MNDLVLDGVGGLEVSAFQRSSDVIVQKSTQEGFGLVVAEGMWKGKPVVGTRVGGIELQIEDGSSGFLVDSRSACADRVVELLHESTLRERLGSAARERVRERLLVPREVEDHLSLMVSLT